MADAGSECTFDPSGAGNTLGVAYYRRTCPKVARAKELLRQGVIGQPLLAYVTCHDWRSGTEPERAGQFDSA